MDIYFLNIILRQDIKHNISWHLAFANEIEKIYAFISNEYLLTKSNRCLFIEFLEWAKQLWDPVDC
jgi:hypothetical protein